MTSNLERDGDDYILLTGRSNPELARDIGKFLNTTVLEPVSSFSDMETRVMIPESLRKRNVFIIQPTSPPANEHIMELLLMIDAARRASAGEITAVIPYFGYARQDRKDRPRVPISSEVVARMIEIMGTRRIITIDLHTDQQMGFFTGPWDNLTAKNVLLKPIKDEGLDNLVVSSTDHGGIYRAKRYKDAIGADGVAIVYKERNYSTHDQSRVVDLLGDVEDKNVLVVDDILTTAGSLINAAEYIERMGAKNIYAAVTHALFVDQALIRIKDSPIKKLFVTDTVAQRPEVLSEDNRVVVATIAPFLAEAIRRVQEGISMSVDMV